MKVTLIRPPGVSRRFAFSLNGTPPLSLAYLAGSLVRAGVEVRIIDAVGEALERWSPGYRPGLYANGLSIPEIVERVDPESLWIGISSMFTHEWPLVRELIGVLGRRLPGVPIVCGGEHATALPEFCLESAPALFACVVGEGEETCVGLTRALVRGGGAADVKGLVFRGKGGAVHTGRHRRIRDVDSIPVPRWDLAPIEAYLGRGYGLGVDRGRSMPILASRGCPFLCTFCSSPRMWTTRYLVREPSLVVDEIETYRSAYRIENVDFYDLTAITRRDWVTEFCQRLIERGSPVTWQLPTGTRSEVIDAKVARLLHAAGCRNVTYAPESGSARTLERIRKRVKLSRMESSMESAVRSGLNVKANIVVGFPDEKHSDFVSSLRFIVRMAWIGVHDLTVFGYSPYPGTRLFDELREARRIHGLDDDYCSSLLTFSNLTGAVSYNERMSSRSVQFYRLFGMALFYFVSFLRRPARVFHLVANLLLGRQESRLEAAFGYMLRRGRGITRRAPGGVEHPARVARQPEWNAAAS